MESVDEAAILLFGMGEEHAAEILKHLDQKQVEKLITSMNKLGDISDVDVVKSLNNFYQQSTTHSSLGSSSKNYIRKTLISAVGNEKASSLLDRAALHEMARGLEIFSWQPAQTIVDLIQDEHPQVIAITLTYLEGDKGAETLKLFDKELRIEVIKRITNIGPISPLGLEELAATLEHELTSVEKFKDLPLGGVDRVADIVNFLDSDTEHEVLEYISASDEELATKIQDRMFPFERIATLEDKTIQTVLREVNNDDLILALKGVDSDVANAFFKNMSARAAEMLKDDLEMSGPQQLCKVEAAQKNVVAVLKKMIQDGAIIIDLGGDSDMVM